MIDLPVQVVRSQRRRRTAQAQMRDGRLRVMVPEGLSRDEESKLVDDLVARAVRKLSSAGIDLGSRGRLLARKYRLPTPNTIEWSARQLTRWGSCTPASGAIRISNRLASMPGWVLDWVIIHELAHLEEPGHGPRFQSLVDRYPLAERAKGYLIAKAEHHPEIASGPGERHSEIG
jgi:predicted metal-dependent hydrolase